MNPLIVIALALTLSGCSTVYCVKDNKEYVLLAELNLSPKERLILHWKTDQRSEYAHLDSRSGKFYYDKRFNYKEYLKNGKDN